MSTETNKALVRRFFEAINTGDLDAVSTIVAQHAVVHNSGAPDPLDLDGFKQLVAMFLAAFPDGEHAVEDMLAEGDKVVTRVTYTGKQTGDMMGIPPTGRPVRTAAMIVDRIADGKIVETWRLFDQMGMMQQLGLLPAAGQAAQEVSA